MAAEGGRIDVMFLGAPSLIRPPDPLPSHFKFADKTADFIGLVRF